MYLGIRPERWVENEKEEWSSIVYLTLDSFMIHSCLQSFIHSNQSNRIPHSLHGIPNLKLLALIIHEKYVQICTILNRKKEKLIQFNRSLPTPFMVIRKQDGQSLRGSRLFLFFGVFFFFFSQSQTTINAFFYCFLVTFYLIPLETLFMPESVIRGPSSETSHEQTAACKPHAAGSAFLNVTLPFLAFAFTPILIFGITLLIFYLICFSLLLSLLCHQVYLLSSADIFFVIIRRLVSHRCVFFVDFMRPLPGVENTERNCFVQAFNRNWWNCSMIFPSVVWSRDLLTNHRYRFKFTLGSLSVIQMDDSKYLSTV